MVHGQTAGLVNPDWRNDPAALKGQAACRRGRARFSTLPLRMSLAFATLPVATWNGQDTACRKTLQFLVRRACQALAYQSRSQTRGLDHAHPDRQLSGDAHWQAIGDAAAEVCPGLFFSLMIIVLSFIPVCTLEAQEGRLFAPLALTKTYAMAAAAGLALTLVPARMGYLIRGKLPGGQANPLKRGLIALYCPLLAAVLRHPKATLAAAALAALVSLLPITWLAPNSSG